MFRKPKRKANKESLRRTANDDTPVAGYHADDKQDSDEDQDVTTLDLLAEARKKLKPSSNTTLSEVATAERSKTSILHTFDATTASDNNNQHVDLNQNATSRAEHHAADAIPDGTAARGADGIFRDTTRNKFYAGPIRAAQNIRVTARFDYQPDICKDYKTTGFCGFGDTCIYLHDRGDTMTGWQLEQQWEQEQAAKKNKQELEMDAFVARETTGGGGNRRDGSAVITDDGLPFACYLCRKHFKEPVVTNCTHYFCQNCILEQIKSSDTKCPVCQKDTFGVFNEPAKLIAKKRRVLGGTKAKEVESWRLFFDSFQNEKQSD
jgi:RING finger protein 113A